ncbi:urease accessory protein UreH domain-containing protein [Bacillus massilinigeriensis]|uniref:urease accessory protein UreH domain-containing protein n=1 Tax=Bacillus massilionigeriensis TaxID=1805475 RepID=UPI00096AFA26|nr:sulfite exporter TauE/SafE family protein [Bacillus massilionigeriensis]
MEGSLFSILLIGFVLGIKHALEPDHVIAVSTIASQSKKLSRSSLAGVFWGIGHTLTLFVVGMSVIFMKGEIPEEWALSLEFLVGIMLVYLGVSSIFNLRRIGATTHTHSEINHDHFHLHPVKPSTAHIHKKVSYLKSMFIGIIHGLAGSAAMVVLTMSTVSSVWQGAMYMLVFGLGTVAGMLISTTIIGIPFVLTASKERVNTWLTQATGTISTLFGVYYMYNLGITEGLFSIWF